MKADVFDSSENDVLPKNSQALDLVPDLTLSEIGRLITFSMDIFDSEGFPDISLLENSSYDAKILSHLSESSGKDPNQLPHASQSPTSLPAFQQHNQESGSDLDRNNPAFYDPLTTEGTSRGWQYSNCLPSTENSPNSIFHPPQNCNIQMSGPSHQNCQKMMFCPPNNYKNLLPGAHHNDQNSMPGPLPQKWQYSRADRSPQNWLNHTAASPSKNWHSTMRSQISQNPFHERSHKSCQNTVTYCDNPYNRSSKDQQPVQSTNIVKNANRKAKKVIS